MSARDDGKAGKGTAWSSGTDGLELPWQPYLDYATDFWQRGVLFWDVMRQRGNQYLEHEAQPVKHVLHFDYELVMSGRDLPRPVNYGLVRIKAPEGVEIDEHKRPFIIVDPRAGHGPGIGGSSRTARSAPSSRPAIPAISSASWPSPSRGRPSATSGAPRSPSSSGSPSCIPRPRASPVSSATARPDGPMAMMLSGRARRIR